MRAPRYFKPLKHTWIGCIAASQGYDGRVQMTYVPDAKSEARAFQPGSQVLQFLRNMLSADCCSVQLAKPCRLFQPDFSLRCAVFVWHWSGLLGSRRVPSQPVPGPHVCIGRRHSDLRGLSLTVSLAHGNVRESYRGFYWGYTSSGV